MAKGKKRKGLRMLSLLLVMVLMIGAYVWYINRDKAVTEEPTEEAATTIPLDTIDPNQIQSFHFVNADADMTLIKDKDLWKSESELERPINQNYVSNMIAVIDEVVALRVINENPEDLGEYGLVEPSVLVEATQTDGKSLTLRIGDASPGTEGYYALVNDQRTVYLIAVTYSLGITYSDSDMTVVEKAPVITSEYIHHIEVLNRDGEDFELLYDTENSADTSGLNLYPWVILKPYAEPYTADGTAVTELLPNYSKFRFMSCVDYNAKDLGVYGLSDPAASIYVEYYMYYTETLEEPEVDETTGETVDTKTYQDDQNIKIFVGNMNEEGLYYVMKEDSNLVYTMEGSVIDTMMTVNAFDVINPYISIMNIEAVDSVDITIEDTPYTMEMKRDITKNAEGEDETQVTYYYNGDKVEEDVFKDVYQVMITTKYDAELKKENSSSAEPYMTISYHLVKDGSTLTSSFLPYDDSFYLVDTGVTRFLADKRKIQAIAAKIIAFTATE